MVTVTLTVWPDVTAGVRAVIVVALNTATLVAFNAPNLTVAPLRKLVPFIVTVVPPVAGPVIGDIVEIDGGGSGTLTYVKAEALVAVWPWLVTLTATAPAAWAGVVALMLVALLTVTAVAAVPPTETVEPAKKLVPLMVMRVPPVLGPLVGLTAVIVGAGWAVPPFRQVSENESENGVPGAGKNWKS